MFDSNVCIKGYVKLQVMLNSYYKRLLNNVKWEEVISQMEKSLSHFVQHMSDQIKQLLYNSSRVDLVLLSLCVDNIIFVHACMYKFV